MFKFNKNYKDLSQVEEFYPRFLEVYQGLEEKGHLAPENSLFIGKIKEIEGEDEERAIYLLQSLKREKAREKYEKKMIEDGFVKLSEDVVKQALEEKKKIRVVGTITNNWAKIKIDEVLKPNYCNGRYGLMKPRARTWGYDLQQFDFAFCKLI